MNTKKISRDKNRIGEVINIGTRFISPRILKKKEKTIKARIIHKGKFFTFSPP